MEENQTVAKYENGTVQKRRHTEASAKALASIRNQLARREMFWKKMCDEINRGATNSRTNSRLILREHESKSDEREITEITDCILSPMQVEGVEEIQKLCRAVGKARAKINTIIIKYELDLPSVMMIELSELLLKADGLIANSKQAVAKLGVKALQQKQK